MLSNGTASDSVVDFVIARNLKINYLTEGGVYYNGLSVSGVNVKYCEGSSWSTKVDSIANGIIDRIYSA